MCPPFALMIERESQENPIIHVVCYNLRASFASVEAKHPIYVTNQCYEIQFCVFFFFNLSKTLKILFILWFNWKTNTDFYPEVSDFGLV